MGGRGDGGDPEVPLVDQLAEMVALREEGKIAHIGLSNCALTQLDEALAQTEIACVQNPHNVRRLVRHHRALDAGRRAAAPRAGHLRPPSPPRTSPP